MSTKEENISNAEILKKNDINIEKNIQIKKELDSKNILIKKLQSELEDITKKFKEIELRTQAEIENIRRRTQIDIEKIHKFSLEKFINELLPVIDNLERTLESTNKQDSNFIVVIKEGIQLTLKSLLDTVYKFGVNIINEVSVPFNPEIHQAMSVMESKKILPNYVLKIIQRGYTLNGRLLRPAMVTVSKEKLKKEKN